MVGVGVGVGVGCGWGKTFAFPLRTINTDT